MHCRSVRQVVLLQELGVGQSLALDEESLRFDRWSGRRGLRDESFEVGDRIRQLSSDGDGNGWLERLDCERDGSV